LFHRSAREVPGVGGVPHGVQGAQPFPRLIVVVDAQIFVDLSRALMGIVYNVDRIVVTSSKKFCTVRGEKARIDAVLGLVEGKLFDDCCLLGCGLFGELAQVKKLDVFFVAANSEGMSVLPDRHSVDLL